MKHKNADIICAWVNGEEIQFRGFNERNWIDYVPDELEIFMRLFYDDYEWRIKPRMIEIKFRLAVCKFNDQNYRISAVDESRLSEPFESRADFVFWLDDPKIAKIDEGARKGEITSDMNLVFCGDRFLP
jgi:hypothetical protein